MTPGASNAHESGALYMDFSVKRTQFKLLQDEKAKEHLKYVEENIKNRLQGFWKLTLENKSNNNFLSKFTLGENDGTGSLHFICQVFTSAFTPLSPESENFITKINQVIFPKYS
jgi:hypothetical protein